MISSLSLISALFVVSRLSIAVTRIIGTLQKWIAHASYSLGSWQKQRHLGIIAHGKRDCSFVPEFWSLSFDPHPNPNRNPDPNPDTI